MRLRIVALAAVAALAYFAVQHRSELPALPDFTVLIVSLRNPQFRFTLGTEPEAPSCDAPITLKVHVIDAAGNPADGLTIEADAAMNGMEHGARRVTLHGKGHGNYEGKIELEIVGCWELDLTTIKGFTAARQRLSIEVGPAQGRPEPHEDDSES